MMTRKLLVLVFVAAIFLLATFLRLYKLGTLPLSPYWEEVAVGYDAFSLLHTARDHHGNFLPLLALESFGDWKPVGYAYAQIPSIALFGLHVFALRLPAALSGVLLVAVVGYLVWKVTDDIYSTLFALFCAAVSPWQILFSRGGWEVMLATALFSWGAVAIVSAVLDRKNSQRGLAVLGTVLLWASTYTYHAMRLLVPMFLLSIALYVSIVASATATGTVQRRLRVVFWELFEKLGIMVLVSFVLFLPFLFAVGTPKLEQRFAETSIFSDIRVIEQSNMAISHANGSLASRLYSHRYVLFAREIVNNYLSHFSPSFLFVSGDENLRHATGFGGQMYYIDSILLLLGIGYVLRAAGSQKKQPWIWLIAMFIFVSPIPASITYGTPHALRTLPLSIGLLSLVAIGAVSGSRQLLIWLYEQLPLKKNTRLRVTVVVSFAIVGLYSVQPIAWWRHYTRVYPVSASSEWQFGYTELVSKLEVIEHQYPDVSIYVTREYGRPAMYYWFFAQVDPQAVQLANITASKDQGEFLTFNQYTFIRSVSEVPVGRAVVVAASPAQLATVSSTETKQLATVKNPLGDTIWQIVLVTR